MILFSFCVTPKRFLHDLLANHKDAQTSASSPVQQIAASGFHCHVDDLVVMAPFLPEIQTIEEVHVFSLSLYYAEPFSSLVHLYLSHADGRGPPASFCI
jgi:hypothetical protein